MLVDSTKFGEILFYHAFSWDEVDVLVCDELPGDDILACCRDHHVQLVTPHAR